MQRCCLSKRNHIKAAIWHERADYGLDPPCPRCDICGRPVANPDMHEWLIRRGHVPKKKQGCIWHRFNCVLLHATCHHKYADGMKDHFRNLQILRYSRGMIEEWLDGLPLKVEVLL